MTIVDSFVQYLESLLGLTFGQNLFVGEAPSTNQVIDPIWWIVASGGNKDLALATGESLNIYGIDIFVRDRNYKRVKDAMFNLEELITCDGCTQLEGFDTIDLGFATLPVDNDLDNEDRKIGLLQATIVVRKC